MLRLKTELLCAQWVVHHSSAGLKSAVAMLNKGGRIAVISFHSLEDRIVKNYFRRESTQCVCPPGLPVCCCGHEALLQTVTRHAVTASEAEMAENSRSSCAKLRVAEKR